MGVVFTILKVLIIITAILFVIYMFNLDMKLVAGIYNKLTKNFDNKKRETKL